MIGRWWRERRIERLMARRAIPDALWEATLLQYPFLQRRDDEDRRSLKRLATVFLAEKEFTGAHGLVVSDAMAVAIAAQACLPVLRLGLGAYARSVGVVVQPGEVLARREITDEIGLVHEYDECLSGEAMEGGPVMLSWQDVAEAGRSAEQGYNVVIHEFVHLIDMADGAATGMPPLPDLGARRHWKMVMEAAYERLCRTLDGGQPSFLDPYAAEGLEEFFPVAAEAFFVAPGPLAEEFPALYALFVGYFGQDPARDASPAGDSRASIGAGRPVR